LDAELGSSHSILELDPGLPLGHVWAFVLELQAVADPQVCIQQALATVAQPVLCQGADEVHLEAPRARSARVVHFHGRRAHGALPRPLPWGGDPRDTPAPSPAGPAPCPWPVTEANPPAMQKNPARTPTRSRVLMGKISGPRRNMPSAGKTACGAKGSDPSGPECE